MGRTLSLYCDGAARGNPGPAAFGFVIWENEEKIEESGGCLGVTTNNVAEYEGLIRGLQRCKELGGTDIVVKTDSELMARQLSGQYKVRSPHLVPLYKQAKELLSVFTCVRIEHVRRHLNKDADELANKALDKKI